MPLRNTLIILGAGYTARHLIPAARQRYTHILATSREPDRHLAHLPLEQRARFDLTQPETWMRLPPETDLLWCFPAVPLELVRTFAEAASLSTRRMVVLGSTSAYEIGASTEYPPSWRDETSAIDLTKPRVQGEEWLRDRCRAIVLRVAGIYGPGRNPIDWIRSGRVQPSRKYVNFIHVEDLARVCLTAFTHAQPSNAYNISDGTPRTWNEICDAAGIPQDFMRNQSDDSTTVGKRISNTRMIEMLASDRTGLQYPDILKEVAKLRQ